MSILWPTLLSALIGGLISPIALREYDKWRQERNWAQPRKELLKSMLGDPKRRFRSIEVLSRTSGCSKEQCRTLLIDLGARGAKLKNGQEGWALLERAPLSESLAKIEKEVFEDP